MSLNTDIRAVPTIAKLTSTSGLPSVVRVLGYYAAGDGGGGDFVKTTSGTTANGGTIFAAAEGGTARFERVYEGSRWSAAWFGFFTTATDVANNTALQNAVNVRAVLGGELYIPPGDYDISGPIDQAPNVVLVGDTQKSSHMRHTGANTLFTATGNYLTEPERFGDQRGWKNLLIQAWGVTPANSSAAKGILAGDGRGIIFDNVQVMGYLAGRGVELRNTVPVEFNMGTEGVQMYNLIVSECLECLAFTSGLGGTAGASFSDLRMFGCWFGTNLTNGKSIYIGPGSTIYAATLDAKLQTSGANPGYVGVYMDGSGSLSTERAAIQNSLVNIFLEPGTPNSAQFVRMAANDYFVGIGHLSHSPGGNVTYSVPATARFRMAGTEQDFVTGGNQLTFPTEAPVIFDQVVRFAAPSANTYYLLATLPISSSSTYDKLEIDWFGGSDTQGMQRNSVVLMNRGGFKYSYKPGGVELGNGRQNVSIQAYTQGDGSAKVYLVGAASQSTVVRIRGRAVGLSGMTTMTNLGIGAATTTAPTGTYVFDTNGWGDDTLGNTSVEQDRGNNSVTLNLNDFWCQRFATAISAARTVTLPSTGLINGLRFRVTRESTATGAFNININNSGGSLIKALGTAGTWAEVGYDGSVWRVVGGGTL